MQTDYLLYPTSPGTYRARQVASYDPLQVLSGDWEDVFVIEVPDSGGALRAIREGNRFVLSLQLFEWDIPNPTLPAAQGNI